MPSCAGFFDWSHELKGRRKVGNSIPCIDGDPAKYTLPENVTLFPKTFRCSLQDIRASTCPIAYFVPAQGSAIDSTFVPYVEMHGPHQDELSVEMGNPGDVYIASSPLTAHIKTDLDEWHKLIPNTLKEHPYLKSIGAIFKERTVVWEPFHTPRSPPLSATTTKRTRPFLGNSPPTAKRKRENTTSTSPSTASPPLASPKQAVNSVNGPANDTPVQRTGEGGRDSAPIPKLQLRINQLRLNDDARQKLEAELKEMKEKESRRDGELAKLREELEAATSRALTLSEETKAIRLALAAAESKREEAEKAGASCQEVLEGLRQTLLREQMRHLKLMKDHAEARRVHGQEAAEMQAIVSNAKVVLEQSVAAEEVLLRDKRELHEQLSEANTSKEALERDLAEEREKHSKLRDRTSQLEVEVKKSAMRSRTVGIAPGTPVPAQPTQLEHRLESLPAEVQSSLMPLIDAVVKSFSEKHDKITAERKRAESAYNMFLAEKNACAEVIRKTNEQIRQVTQERDTALQQGELSQRGLLTLRQHLARLSMADLTPSQM